jgi:hypothetical protein
VIAVLAVLAAVAAPVVVWMTIGRSLLALASASPTGHDATTGHAPTTGPHPTTEHDPTTEGEATDGMVSDTTGDLRIATVVEFDDELLIGLTPEAGSGRSAETLRVPSGAASQAIVQRWRTDATGLRVHRRLNQVLLIDPILGAAVACDPPATAG